MSYQALLFCPDEKTARVVSQVLSELEFTVEPCHEPFAAVNRLMAQHFDAIVVDCENEQNAALLFKSARNSGSNQSSLAVAVVEGQAGVAKAFRLGANLVLTKPIHIEQSKATLRVARGLLRKGQAAAKSAGVTNSQEPAAGQMPSPSTPFPPQQSSTPAPMASASAFELDAEPTPAPDPAEAALLEYMPDSAFSGAESSPQSATDSNQAKQYPWQPRSNMAEPMASALRRAAEVAGKSEFDAPSQGHASQGKTGAAAAPARAKEIPSAGPRKLDLEPAATVMPARIKPERTKTHEPVHAEALHSELDYTVTDEPNFTSRAADQQASAAGGSKKTLLIAMLLLAVAAAAYFGWTRMQVHQNPALQPSVAPPSSSTPALPPQPAPSVTEDQPAPGELATQQVEPGLTAPSANPSSSKPSAAVFAEVPGTKVPAAAAAEDDVTVLKSPAVKEEPSTALVVKSGPSTRVKHEAEAQEPEQVPAATSIATGSDNTALSGLVNAPAASVPRGPQQTLRISQGVSQGLLIKRVQPVYPPQAMQMRVEGKVELQANISKTGSIESVKQLSGDAILGRAAIDAVRQWKYKPYFLNSEPVEIQTQITVNFKLP